MREREDWLVKAAISEGHPIPASALDDGPDLRADLEFHLVAYEDLSTTREASFGGPRPLSWMAIRAYADCYGVEDFEEFHAIIRGVDSAFLEYMDELDEAKKEQDRGAEHDRKSDPSIDRPPNGTRSAPSPKRPRKNRYRR